MVRDDGEEGVLVVVPAKHWWLPQPEKLGGQHDGGVAYQELVVRLKLELKSKVLVMRKTQSADPPEISLDPLGPPRPPLDA